MRELTITSILVIAFFLGLLTGIPISTEDKQVDKLMSQCNNQLQKENAPRKTTCELTYKFVEKG